MSQNRSSAVMQQRAEPHDSLDDFPTPPWATRAFIEHGLKPVLPEWLMLDALSVWEPACNRGFMARPLAEYFGKVTATDVHDYGWTGQQGVEDFLFPGAGEACDFVITNPPFRLAHAFIARGLEVARHGVAVLVRSAFLEGVNRHDSLFAPNPPTLMAQYAERVAMVKGRCDPQASTATAYCWLLWLKDDRVRRRQLAWIPPSRDWLERPGDYEVPA